MPGILVRRHQALIFHPTPVSASGATAVIYFLQNERSKAIKIGFSNNPLARVRDLSTANSDALALLGVIPGDVRLESDLHCRFSPWRIRGEWFEPHPELLATIESLVATDGISGVATIGANLWDECRSRNHCRTGLQGVEVRLPGERDTYFVFRSKWDKLGNLLVTIFPSSGPPPVDRWRKTDGIVACLADFLGTEYPPGTLYDIRAEQCVLVSDWPVSCCKPDRSGRHAHTA